jgi:Ser/Thr protein kinase RdoA (MazF antagonist)
MTDSANPLDILAAAVPAVPESVVLDLLAREYGLTGSLALLVSERDQNFRLDTQTGRQI